MTSLPPLTDDDLDTLAELLARFAANHLDQWEAWAIDFATWSAQVSMVTLGRRSTEADGLIHIWSRPTAND